MVYSNAKKEQIVVTTIVPLSSNTVNIDSETTWIDLYPFLRSIARCVIYSFRVASWYGQEEDLIEDVVQETICKIIERTRKAERGEVEPIYSLKHITVTIVQNYSKDLRRSDRRLSHITPQVNAPESFVSEEDQALTLDAVTERVFE